MRCIGSAKCMSGYPMQRYYSSTRPHIPIIPIGTSLTNPVSRSVTRTSLSSSSPISSSFSRGDRTSEACGGQGESTLHPYTLSKRIVIPSPSPASTSGRLASDRPVESERFVKRWRVEAFLKRLESGYDVRVESVHR
jgi:hypothetical protein